MADAPWFAVNIDYWRNPKVAEAGFLAATLNLAAIAYCAEQLTDGFVPTMVVPILAAPMHGYVWVGEDGVNPTPADVADSRWHNLAETLVFAGLWEVVDNGWRIVNYLDHQPSRVEVEARKERARENGRKGGRAKAETRLPNPTANPGANPPANRPASEMPSNPPSESVAPAPAPRPSPTELQNLNPSSSPLRGDDFQEFWQVYPRRAGKKAAEKAWTKAVKATPAAQILGGAARFRDDPNREQACTPHPATWLNQGRWDDDPLPTRLRPVSSRVQEQDDTLRRWHDQAVAGQMPELGA